MKIFWLVVSQSLYYIACLVSAVMHRADWTSSVLYPIFRNCSMMSHDLCMKYDLGNWQNDEQKILAAIQVLRELLDKETELPPEVEELITDLLTDHYGEIKLGMLIASVIDHQLQEYIDPTFKAKIRAECEERCPSWDGKLDVPRKIPDSIGEQPCCEVELSAATPCMLLKDYPDESKV